MRSRIYEYDEVKNKDRKFGSALSYFPCYFQDMDGNMHPILFTEAEIEKAKERADKNPEDFTPDEYAKWLELFD